MKNLSLVCIVLWYKYITDEKAEITLQDVWLQLLKEEAAERKGPDVDQLHKVSLTSFITTGFDIEDRQ